MEIWSAVSVDDVTMTLDHRHTPTSVLAFVFTPEGDLVWVQHPRRGWEVPGGKIEPGEEPVAALNREVFEESGVHIQNPQWVAEYQILVPSRETGHPVTGYKWVYVAGVMKVGTKPIDSEIISVRTDGLRDPSTLRMDDTVSPVMKDGMYEALWPLLKRRH